MIRYIAFLTGGLNFVGSGSLIIVLILIKNQGGTPFLVGVAEAIASVGGILGAVIGGAIQKRFSFAQVIIATVWIQALAWPLLAIAPNFAIIGIVSAVVFMAGPIYNVVQFSYRLSLIPDELQGRVNSVFRLLAFGFQPIGLAAAGALVEGVGANITVLIFGGMLVLLAILTNTNPYVRRANRATISGTAAS